MFELKALPLRLVEFIRIAIDPQGVDQFHEGNVIGHLVGQHC